MGVDITCYVCFETFSVELDMHDGLNEEIWDCEICCNPNRIKYLYNNKKLVLLEVYNGND